MITKLVDAENEFTDPLFVAREERFLFECREYTTAVLTDSLDAVITIQWVLYDEELSRPADDDARWTDVEEYNAGSGDISHVSNAGNAWYRVGVKTGDYVQGVAELKVQTCRAA